MGYLFIDSTYDLTLGVLDDGMEWLSLETVTGQKASAVIQKLALDLLNRHGLVAASIKGVITVNGPGFYTGLRLAEGFADVFTFFGVKQFSFYTYEIPFWCGHSSGMWFTKAYRGEYFLYSWDGNTSETKLLSAKELPDLAWTENKFIHSATSLDSLASSLIGEVTHTQDLLKLRPALIFKHVLSGEKREPYYFRAPEDEFKVNP